MAGRWTGQGVSNLVSRIGAGGGGVWGGGVVIGRYHQGRVNNIDLTVCMLQISSGSKHTALQAVPEQQDLEAFVDECTLLTYLP